MIVTGLQISLVKYVLTVLLQGAKYENLQSFQRHFQQANSNEVSQCNKVQLQSSKTKNLL